MIEKAHNKTRYNTEDLNALLLQMASCTADLFREVVTFPRSWWVAPDVQLKVIYLPKIQRRWEPYEQRTSRELTGAREVTYLWRQGSEYRLRLPTWPSVVRDTEPLELLSTAESGHQTLPKWVVESIWASMLSGMVRQSRVTDVGEKVRNKFRAKASELHRSYPVRMEERVEASPTVNKKLTPEERLKKLQSRAFYGRGGVLKGPDGWWGWRSGQRSPHQRWESAVHQAHLYYQRELKHRMKYKPKIEKLGGTAPAYESFADWLRQQADLYEEKDKADG